MYFSLYTQLKKQNLVSDEAIFVSGAKINTGANKYSFVWRKTTEKKRPSLIKERVN